MGDGTTIEDRLLEYLTQHDVIHGHAPSLQDQCRYMQVGLTRLFSLLRKLRDDGKILWSRSGDIRIPRKEVAA